MEKMKKGCLALCLVLLLVALVGCDATDYKKATELYESGKYAEAQAMFEELGDYEDSRTKAKDCQYMQAKALMDGGKYAEAQAIFEKLGDYKDSKTCIQDCKWYSFVAYVENNDLGEPATDKNVGEYRIECAGKTSLNIIWENEVSTDFMEAKTKDELKLTKSGTTVEVTKDLKMSVGSSKSYTECEYKLDISGYKKSNKLTWNQIKSGSNVYKNTNSWGSDTMTITVDAPEEVINPLLEYVQRVIKKSGLSITLGDLGFTSY